MSDKTGIEWTNATWNPVWGCTAVSPGCDHCYAEKLVNGRLAHLHPGGFGTVRLRPDVLDKPLRWRKPRRIFVNSMSDLFHDDVPDGYIAQVWEVMARCPQHTFQILTKRHGRMRSWVNRWHDNTGDHEVVGSHGLPPMPRGPEAVREVYSSPRAMLFADMLDSMGAPPPGAAYPLYDWMEGPRFSPGVLPNVLLGVSVESQKWADIRIPALLDTPAAMRFLSCEPLLGPVDITGDLATAGGSDSVDWVICGGESGPGARPMHPDWARSLRDQCVAAGVPFLFKQWGEWAPEESAPAAGARWTVVSPHAEEPALAGAGMRRVGKKAAGRELDGRTWDEYPDGAS